MSQSGAAFKLWLSATIGAAAIVLLVLSLFRVPVLEQSSDHIPKTVEPRQLELASRGNELLIEEVGLRDPTPLFLPTPWNASEDALAMSAPREPGGSFQDYAPHFNFPASELTLELPATSRLPTRAADVFAIDETGRSLFGFGEIADDVRPLPVRDGFIEIVGAADGAVLMRQPLVEIRPPERGTWQPMEFLVAIDSAGVVGPPVLTESSRAADVDSFFKDYIVKVLQIGSRLTPGFYRINIGP